MVSTCTIVIPTYNEEKNIVNIAKAIREAYPEFRILFMDDNSTDRGKELIDELNDPLTKVFVRKPEDRGLGASVLQGFEIAETDYAICMDCDFQHPIATLQGIYDELEKGADLCVGRRNSRMSMGFKRAFGSEAFELFCKINMKFHGVQTTKDMMSGLFGLRCDKFRPEIQSNWDNFEIQGWKVLMDLLKYAPEKLKVSYVRYEFGLRAEGESHLNPKVPIMTVHQLWGFGKFIAKFLAKMYHIDYYAMYPKEKK
ncbi:MAG: glycosyltransferase [archaeon]|nr:glycosyltransferase [archaeon]